MKVTPSCGCVFCDIGLRADSNGWHNLDFGKGKMARQPSEIKCTKQQEPCAEFVECPACMRRWKGGVHCDIPTCSLQPHPRSP